MPNVFTYGSLMFNQVWAGVVTGKYDHASATLPGYVRKSVFDAEYPVIYPASTSEVEGIVYFQVESDDIARLDHFEGMYYKRETVLVKQHDGEKIAAHAFILKDEFRSIATAHAWDPEEFEKTGLPHFIRSYIGFDRAGGGR
jgi:gamma-glutamylcyclotransferase (GGCT)/AIG2-like uncharacterized protein YtfP